jgi:hypothetical protein
METTTYPRQDIPVTATNAVCDPLAQQVKILYSQSVITFLFPLLAALCIVTLLHDQADRRFLAGWLIAIFLHGVSRYYLLWRYFHGAALTAQSSAWMNRFLVGAFLSGGLWGFAGILLIPYRSTEAIAFTLNNGLLLLMICGLVAGSVISYAINIRVTLCYSLPALLPPALHLISIGDRYNSAFGGLLLLYSLYILVAAIRMNRQLVYFLNMEHRERELAQKYGNLQRLYESLRRRVKQVKTLRKDAQPIQDRF